MILKRRENHFSLFQHVSLLDDQCLHIRFPGRFDLGVLRGS